MNILNVGLIVVFLFNFFLSLQIYSPPLTLGTWNSRLVSSRLRARSSVRRSWWCERTPLLHLLLLPLLLKNDPKSNKMINAYGSGGAGLLQAPLSLSLGPSFLPSFYLYLHLSFFWSSVFEFFIFIFIIRNFRSFILRFFSFSSFSDHFCLFVHVFVWFEFLELIVWLYFLLTIDLIHFTAYLLQE